MPARSETVSVIVPIYNAETTLRRCLSSLRKQTYPDLEILMLDDGSTDGSPDICREFADADPRFRFFPLPPRHNVAAVRNSGLERFTGEYLMFADADDLVSDNYVERLLEVLKESGCDLASCVALDTGDTKMETYHCGERGPVRIIELRDHDFRQRWSRRVVWGAICKRELVKGLRFDEKYHTATDTLFSSELLKKTERIAHIEEPLYVYVYYPDSVCHHTYDRRRFSEVLVWEEIAHRVFANGPDTPRKTAELTVYHSCMKGIRELLARECPDRDLLKDLVRRFTENRSAIRGLQGIGKSTRRKYLALAYAPHLYLCYCEIRQRRARKHSGD